MWMLTVVRRLLDFEMTVAEWIGTAAMLAAPYLLIGLLWTAIHIDRLDGLAAIIGSIAAWPAMLVSAVCLT